MGAGIGLYQVQGPGSFGAKGCAKGGAETLVGRDPMQKSWPSVSWHTLSTNTQCYVGL